MRSLFLLNSGEGEQLVDVGRVVVPSGDLREQIIDKWVVFLIVYAEQGVQKKSLSELLD